MKRGQIIKVAPIDNASNSQSPDYYIYLGKEADNQLRVIDSNNVVDVIDVSNKAVSIIQAITAIWIMIRSLWKNIFPGKPDKEAEQIRKLKSIQPAGVSQAGFMKKLPPWLWAIVGLILGALAVVYWVVDQVVKMLKGL